MIPRLNWRRVALASTSLILGLAAMVSARAATVLTAASVQKLVVAEDSANFLAQVALMAGQVPQVSGLTSDQQSGLIQGSWSDVQTAAPALVNVQVVAGAAGTNAAVALRLKKAVNALTADITNLGNAVTANPLSAATQTAFQTMGQDAQALVKEIQRDYALLPPTQRPVELTLATAAGQARVFSANATVKFVLSGPKAAITGGNGTWAMSSGRQNAAQPPLSTPFTKGTLTGSSASARQAMQAKATTWGAWTYVYYQYGVRRPELLLLNLGTSAAVGNTTGGGSLATGTITTNAGGSLVVNSSDSTLTLTGNINNGSGSLTKVGTGTLVLSGTDTYTGGTTINGGTLSITSNSTGVVGGNLTINGGTLQVASLSSLGASTSSGSLLINGGTLQYTGPGSSTDHAFTLGANGATIAASGTGPITFDNTGNLSFNGSSATTLTLAGDNTGNNTLSAAIGDENGGSVSVTKTGSGTWVLTGNNTYTGNTTVNAGTLVITNLWFPPGSVFVLGTGTFTYQPDANDSLTVSAVMADGSAYAWGDTTYEVDVQTDGSWVLPALNAQIVTVTGGYEIVPWTGAGSGSLDGGNPSIGGLSGNLDSGGVTFSNGNGYNILNSGGSNNGGTLSGSQSINIFFLGNHTITANPLNLGSGIISINVTANASLVISGNIQGGGNASLIKTGDGPLVLSGNDTYPGNTTVNGGTLTYTHPTLPPGDIFVVGTGTFEYQPDANDSLVVSALAVAGSTYAWGDTTYEVDVQADGSWVLPALNAQIVAVTGGYEIVPWTPSSSSGELGGVTIAGIGGGGAATDDTGAGTLTINTNPQSSLGANNPLTIAVDGTLELVSASNFTWKESITGAGNLLVTGGAVYTFSGNDSMTGMATISNGTLILTNPHIPTGNIFVVSNGTFAYQPDASESLTVSAVPADGSAYPWGDTTYEVDVQTDGSWVLPALGVQIVAVTGGYEIVPWVAPGG